MLPKYFTIWFYLLRIFTTGLKTKICRVFIVELSYSLQFQTFKRLETYMFLANLFFKSFFQKKTQLAQN